MAVEDPKLKHLLNLYGTSLDGRIWRGTQSKSGRKSLTVVGTGHKKLNQALHTGGWPLNTTTELGLSQPGIGELRLLLPALRSLQQRNQSQTQQNIIWVAPPFLPYAPGLIKEQIDVNKLTIVQTNTIQDTLWATEQALQAECCAAVFCWTGHYNLSNRELRRIQLAAENTHTWNVLFRHSDCLKQSSAAGLRLHLHANAHSKLDLHILKQPNGWGGQRCTISLHPHYENWQRLPVHLLPHHNQHQVPVLPDLIETSHSTEHRQATVTVLHSLSTLQSVQ